MNYKQIQNKIKNIRNIGHTHEEVEEWFKCTDCMTAHGKAIAEETKMKRLFPKEFIMHQLRSKAPREDKYIHKL